MGPNVPSLSKFLMSTYYMSGPWAYSRPQDTRDAISMTLLIQQKKQT